MSNRTRYNLGDLIDSVSETFQFSDAPVVFLNTSDIFNGKILSVARSNPNDLPGQAKKSIRNGDFLFSEIRPGNKRFALVDVANPHEFVVSTKLMVLRCRENITPEYLKYFLTSASTLDYLQRLAEHRSGTFPQITFRQISDIQISLPPRDEQEQIVRFISVFDEKIELNRRMNVTLEEIARALFKAWFVDFEPVHANREGRPSTSASPEIAKLFPSEFENGIPKGWQKNSICEIANVHYGAPFSSRLFNTERVGIPLLRIRDLSTNNPQVFTEEVHPKGRLIRAGDIVVGMDGEFRSFWWLGGDVWLNQRVCCFEPRKPANEIFVKFTIEGPLSFFERSKVGTTVIHLGKSDIDRIKVEVPPSAILEEFARLSDGFLKYIVNNAKVNKTLQRLRDLLLPKLIVGEVAVKDQT